MNIYFSGSIRGGRAEQPRYAHIVEVLRQYGTVTSPHVSDSSLSHYGETHLSAQEVLERELSALKRTDIVVAEVTVPSLGVGYLIAHATFLGKRVIALYRGDDTLKLSTMIKGDPRVEVFICKTNADIEKALKTALWTN